MKKILLLLLMNNAYLLFSAPSHFLKEFGDSSLINYGNSAQQLPGGSIFFTGTSNSNTIGGYDISLSKLDADGNMLWRKYFGTTDDEFCARMIYANNALIICGQSYNNASSTADGYLLAVDTNGNELWQHTYGTPALGESFAGLCASVDGGLIVCGLQSGQGLYAGDFWLIKTDAGGNLQWETTYGDHGIQETSDAVLQLSNGDIFISGDKGVNTATYNAWLLKADSLGNEIWNKVMSNTKNGGCKNICFSSDHFIYVVGEAATDSSANFDMQICKVDTSGNLRWLRYLRGTNESDAAFDIKETPDQRFMLTGYFYDTAEWKKKIPMVLIDSAGNELGKKIFCTGIQNIGYEIIPSINGGYLVAGTDFMNSQCILIYDEVTDHDGIEELNGKDMLHIFPNPATGEFTIELPGANCIVDIMTPDGRIISSEEVQSEIYKSRTNRFEHGIHFLRCRCGEKDMYGKLVIE